MAASHAQASSSRPPSAAGTAAAAASGTNGPAYHGLAHLDAYTEGELIGQGSFGVIHKVTRKSDGMVRSRLPPSPRARPTDGRKPRSQLGLPLRRSSGARPAKTGPLTPTLACVSRRRSSYASMFSCFRQTRPPTSFFSRCITLPGLLIAVRASCSNSPASSSTSRR
jgi:hypothetical protein